MKNKTYRFAVALAVLLALCLVFVAPVGAIEDTDENNGVAELGGQYYSTLQLAVNDAANGQTVTLLKDTELTTFLTINKEVILDLSSFNITRYNGGTDYTVIWIATNGNLTIKGSGAVKSESTTLNNDGKVTIYGGTFEGEYGLYNKVGGTAVIYGGTFKSVSTSSGYADRAIANCGNLEINGGTISGELDSSAKLVINSGSIETLIVKEPDYNTEETTTTINSGTIGELQYFDEDSSDQSSVDEGKKLNKLTINGGTISSMDDDWISGANEGGYDITITGGEIPSAAGEYISPGVDSITTEDGKILVGSSIPAPAVPTASSSVTPTPGAYFNYPRTTEDGGLVEFGTSKVVKSITLPAGSSGKVNLHIDSTAYWPLSLDSEFTFDISVDNLGEGTSYISFKIVESKLTALELTAADVGVYHNVNGEWVKLVVTYTIEDGDVIYTAETDSFSPFKLVIEEGAAVQKEEVTPSEPVVDEPVTPDVPQDIPGEVLPEIPPVDEHETPASPAPLLAVLAGLGAAVLLRRK